MYDIETNHEEKGALSKQSNHRPDDSMEKDKKDDNYLPPLIHKSVVKMDHNKTQVMDE